MKNEPGDTRHLRPQELFLLTMPPAGDPEELPAHLSSCTFCARQLAEWKKAVRELSATEAEPSEDFERMVMAGVRRQPTPVSHRIGRRVRAFLAAAACLLLAFWGGLRVGASRKPEVPQLAGETMSPRDREDDELLRSVSRLVSGEEGSPWKDLAPLPENSRGTS